MRNVSNPSDLTRIYPMTDALRIFRQFAVVVSITVLLIGCGGGSTSDSADIASGPDFSNLSPNLGSAVVQLPVEGRRIAIVHSETSKTKRVSLLISSMNSNLRLQLTFSTMKRLLFQHLRMLKVPIVVR